MKRNELFFNYYSSVSCKIYVLGNSSEGESIIFILYVDNDIIYSCITDSFLYQNKPAVDCVLNSMNINHITDLFWSHPHDDHSAGLIDIIEKYKPKHVFIPAELHDLSENVAEISKNTLHKLNEYPSYDGRYSYQPIIQGIGLNHLIKKVMIRVGTKIIPFSIFAISPCLGKVRRKSIVQDYNSLNDYSIAISIVIGDFSILLTGDVQDKMLQYLLSELCEDVPVPNILKIPHHGSDYSLCITSIFNEVPQFDIAITTAKKSSKLPKDKALRHYKTFSNSLYKIDNHTNISDLAIWGIEVDIINAKITQITNKNYTLM